jgi:hypothetical protein
MAELGVEDVLPDVCGERLLYGARTVQPHFVGSGCSISTCRYFTSSYSTARYYYDRRTCSQWKSLSNTYLRGFNTVTALHNKYPKRVLHAPC